MLKFISDNPGTSQKNLIEKLNMDQPTVSRILEPLQDMGYVIRKPKPGDVRWLEYHINIDKFKYLNKKIKTL